MRDPDFGLWGETAEPAPEVSPLPGDRSADAAIVGAGFTGLSTALHLAERGITSLVLDAQHPGFGASGATAAKCFPGSRLTPTT
jgi:sarcosine oxidase